MGAKGWCLGDCGGLFRTISSSADTHTHKKIQNQCEKELRTHFKNMKFKLVV